MDEASFLGRGAELATIGRFFDALPGDARCLLLEGEAGIGKTTLLRWGSEEAASRGFLTLSASPVEAEVPWEFAALADLLEAVPRSSLDALPPAQRRAINVAVFRYGESEEPVDPRTIAAAVLALLRSLAAATPVVLIIDDLQWLDVPSAGVLSFVLRRITGTSVGLLATVRTGWSGDPPPLVTDAMGADNVERVDVGPLGLAAMQELLSNRTSLTPDRATLLHLAEISRGNPFFLLELVAGRDDLSDDFSDTADVPVSLRRLVLDRLGALPVNARDVLLVCALAGDPEEPVVVAATADPMTAVDGLDLVLRAGVVQRSRGSITFSHPLIRSVVTGDASAGMRRAAHRRLAAVVGHREDRARHVALAAAGPDEATAGELEYAATVAGARGAHHTAATLARLSVGLTPATQVDDRHRRTALEAGFCFEAHDPARSATLLESIIDDVPAGGGRAELLRRLARSLAFRGDPMSTWIGRLTEALEESSDDLALRAAILVDLAVAVSNVGDRAGARHYGTLALEMVEDVGDKACEAQLCAGMAFTTFCDGGGVRHDLVERALSGAEQPPLLSVDLRPNVTVGHLRLLSDDLDGARVLYEEEYQRTQDEGVVTGLPLMIWGFALTEAWAGNWVRAEELVSEGCDLAGDAGCWPSISAMSGVSGLMHVYRGRLSEGRRECERALAVAREVGLPLFGFLGAGALGLAELSVGDAAAAHEHLAALAEPLRAGGVTEPGILRFLPDEIEALIRLGQLGPAEELLDPFELRSVELDRRWGTVAAGRCRGMLLAGRGDLKAAGAALDVALERQRHLPMPFEHARTLMVAGEIQRRSRQRSRARQSLEAAATIFGRLGAPLWEQRAGDELGRLGLRGPRDASRSSDLTPMEQQVADLVVAGLTNIEVAAQLFMGQRTVEAHLSRIYQKLGIRSRTQLSRVRPPPDAVARD
ncbi:MAG: helix-turn-helix transcriptional regulator [Acidimicrobiales bacterium]